MNHKNFYMQSAIDLAAKGKYTAPPNPNVGCVIVENSKIISKAYHQRAGKEHAEILALKNLKKKVNDKMIMYINLEPCCHYGKTAPCTKTLINSGIKNIEIAMLDPNPKVRGKGVKELRKNGIKVNVGSCKIEAVKINKDFVTKHEKKRPYIIIKQAVSLDSKITSPNKKWISNKFSREDGHYLRAQSCAILVSSKTIINDNPKLNVRLTKKKLSIKSNIRHPIIVILDSNLTVDITRFKVFKTKTKKIIFNSIKTTFDKKNNIDFIKVVSNKNGLSIQSIMKTLSRDYDVKNLLIEPGKRLLSSFLDKNIFDEIIFYRSSSNVGDGGLETVDIEKTYLNTKKIYQDSVKNILNDVKITYKPKR